MANCLLNRLRRIETETYSEDNPLQTVTPSSIRGESSSTDYPAYAFNTWISGWAILNVSSVEFWWGGEQRAYYYRGGAGQQGTEYPKVFIPKNQALTIKTVCKWSMSTSLTFYKCPLIEKGKQIIGSYK